MQKLEFSHLLRIGKFDVAKRYTLLPEFETPTSREIRSPSRAFPYSVLRHCLTKKYFDSLSNEQKRKILGE